MKPKILLGDDNAGYRKSCKRFISMSTEFDVDEASTPSELAEKAQSGGYVGIITDLDYGEGQETGGIKAIERIRRAGIKTPILLQSGTLTEKSVDEAKKAGATEVIEKSEIEKLREALEKLKEAGK